MRSTNLSRRLLIRLGSMVLRSGLVVRNFPLVWLGGLLVWLGGRSSKTVQRPAPLDLTITP